MYKGKKVVSNLNKEYILNYLREHKDEFKSKYQVNKIGLFGSYVNDSATQYSDIDLIVDMPSSFKNYYALKNSLESHFNKKVDLGMLHTIRTFIKNRIEKDILYV